MASPIPLYARSAGRHSSQHANTASFGSIAALPALIGAGKTFHASVNDWFFLLFMSVIFLSHNKQAIAQSWNNFKKDCLCPKKICFRFSQYFLFAGYTCIRCSFYAFSTRCWFAFLKALSHGLQKGWICIRITKKKQHFVNILNGIITKPGVDNQQKIAYNCDEL